MILGIDLGTKNSLIGFYDGTINLVQNEFESMMTPSVVHIDEEGNVLVGVQAKQRLLTHPERTFEMFKRELGTKTIYTVNGKQYTPTHLSSFILQKLVSDFTSQFNHEVDGVIISVPAYFNESQRYETKKAGRLAGLNVIQILNEPSAAAIYSNREVTSFNKTIILDMGGGTFDISIMECFEQVFEILSIAGDINLGGQDYTNALVDLCCKKGAITETEELVNLCEHAKMRLTNDSAVTVIECQGKKISISFEEYYTQLSSVNERIYPIFIKALRDASIHDINLLENIIFIGGGSNLYAFRKYIYTLLSTTEENKMITLKRDCDLAVAKGVVLYSGVVSGHETMSDIVLTDVCPFSLGLSVYSSLDDQRHFEVLIPRNSTLPITKSGIYSPYSEKQTQVNIRVFQGEHFDVDRNTFLGNIKVPCSSTKDVIIVSFTYDINSILKVKVQNLAMNLEEEIFIHHDTNLEEKDKEELIQELNSIKHIDRQQERQNYYMEKLTYLFETAHPEKREYFYELMEIYTKLIKSGTYKQQRQLENRIDHEDAAIINLALSNEDPNPFYS